MSKPVICSTRTSVRMMRLHFLVSAAGAEGSVPSSVLPFTFFVFIKPPHDCRLASVTVKATAGPSSWSNLVSNMWNDVFFINPHTNINTPISIKHQPYVIFPVDRSICSKSASRLPHLPPLSLRLPLTLFPPSSSIYPSMHFSLIRSKCNRQKLPFLSISDHRHTFIGSWCLFPYMHRCLSSACPASSVNTTAPRLQEEKKIEKL